MVEEDVLSRFWFDTLRYLRTGLTTNGIYDSCGLADRFALRYRRRANGGGSRSFLRKPAEGSFDQRSAASKSYSSIPALLLPVFNLFGKEIKAQRTRRLIKAYILALKLIALHKKIRLKFTADGVLVLQGNLNILRYKSTEIVRRSTACQGCSPSICVAAERP